MVMESSTNSVNEVAQTCASFASDLVWGIILPVAKDFKACQANVSNFIILGNWDAHCINLRGSLGYP